MIIKLLLFLIIAIVIYLLCVYHIKIKWKTFFKKGFKVEKKPYGVYCFCGKQGKGKTYSVVEFLKDHKDMKIYANIKSLKDVKYEYFCGFEQLLQLRSQKNCIIFFDEIFTALTKSSKLNTEVLDFLSQMRKRNIIFLTTAQEWLEINMTLRRYCRFQIDCNIISPFFLSHSILIKTFKDAEKMKWDQLENEYIAPIINITISKCNLQVANSYDTYEQISSVANNKQIENKLKLENK